MLDVHAPEHPIHGVREFFVHLFTITCGLLIALGLENTVEWRHHVHVRHEAEATMRRELKENQKDLRVAIAAIPAEMQAMKDIEGFLQAKARNQPGTGSRLSVGITEATLEDAAWNSASATGALSYMDFSEVQRFSSAYHLQQKFESIQEQALPPMVALMAALGTGDPNNLTPQQAADTLQQVHLSMAHLSATQSFGKDVDRIYNEALKDE